jgi:transposase
MSYRELSVQEVFDVLRFWAAGKGQRESARLAQVDRKTARRYVAAARRLGLAAGGVVDDGLVGAVVESLRPGRAGERGAAWRACEAERGRISGWLQEGVALTKVKVLLARHGVEVPYRTLHRFAVDGLGFGRRKATLRVATCAPGEELQVDFGELGRLADTATGRRHKVQAMVFTAVFSRHLFVWLTLSQRTEDVIEGFEQAWAFFGGVFKVVVVDNFKAAVVRPDPCEPRLSDALREYAQARGFHFDPARVRSPQDKPHVESGVGYVQSSFWAGERFATFELARSTAVRWCLEVAGQRVHGSTRQRPMEVFETTEKPALLPAPSEPFDVPRWQDAKVQRDQHLQADHALYSMPAEFIGKVVRVRLDRALCRVYWQSRLVVAHPRQVQGKRSTLDAHFDAVRAMTARRDVQGFVDLARGHGAAVGRFAERLVADSHATFHAIRQLYRLLGLVRRFGATAAERACAALLGLDLPDLARLKRLLESAGDRLPAQPPLPPPVADPKLPANVVPLRFARDASQFAVQRPATDKDRAHHPEDGGDHAA